MVSALRIILVRGIRIVRLLVCGVRVRLRLGVEQGDEGFVDMRVADTGP